MAKVFLFNPYTGTPRHPSDIASDPEGLAIVDDTVPLRAALAATPAPVEPVAWQYTLEYGASIADRKVSLEQLRYPFGVCGADYLRVNSDGVSYVRETPLFAAPVAQAEPRKPLTESALCREVCEYGPQSEDEETGFRDGFRAAERVHGIKEQA